ncbi:hypothetical protein [Hymenobacter pini]|uniref:hypothetical protein n=1 Tax=Hymenobacter pini TaxID=2880879 RepID=UPI001CF3401E|nr:hypothetical protein [Hymenobacter pini]MCA8832325.1 hypothetical protein [Hymenobacter pini]
MRNTFLGAAVLSALFFPLAGQSAQAQTPDSAATRAAVSQSAGSGTLLRLGTGLTRGLYTDYWGLSAPLSLGVEHHLTPQLSVYANGFAGFRIGQRNYFEGSRVPLIGTYGFDAGVRYYYNQVKRRQQGKEVGPFVGNYLALQTTTTFNTVFTSPYQCSMLMLTWGMQRRLGRYGWLDAYVGGGIGREPGRSYPTPTGTGYNNPRWSFRPEVGIKFSLGQVVK